MHQGPDRKQLAHLNWVTRGEFDKGTIDKGVGEVWGSHKGGCSGLQPVKE